MVQYLSAEFLSELEKRGRQLPERPHSNVVVQYVVSGAPDRGEVRYFFRIQKGRIEEARLGDVDDPAFTITTSYENSVRLQQGKLHPSAAFMTGKMRASGNRAKLMAMMPMVQSREYQAMLGELREISEY
jgi:hypothetical protein